MKPIKSTSFSHFCVDEDMLFCDTITLVVIPTKGGAIKLYLDAMVKVPNAPGKITYRTKGKTTYVEYEYEGL